MFVYKNSNLFFTKQNGKPTSEDGLLNIKVIYTNTSFGRKFIYCLGPVNFNTLSIDIKK